MSKLGDFSVRSQSRFPIIPTQWNDRYDKDYDTKTHRYTDHYLHPTYTLHLAAYMGETEVIDIPDDVVSFDWTVTSQDGSFQKHVSTPVVRSKFNDVKGVPGLETVKVPKPGVYDIHLQVRVAAGGGPTHDERFNLRDFLVVSIGDSYASGEGNPDRPGKPEGLEINVRRWWELLFVPILNTGKGRGSYRNFRMYKITEAAIEWGLNKLKGNPTLAEALNLTVAMGPLTARWFEEKAHRSLRGGPAVAAQLLQNDFTGDLVSFVSFARSGAEVDDGLFGPRTEGKGKDRRSIDGWIGDVGELSELRQLAERLGSRRIDALVISIGGSDAGFSGRLRDLVEEDSTFLMLVSGQPPEPGDPGAKRRGAKARVDAALDRLSGTNGKPGSLDRLADALHDINIGQVYVTEYPTAHFDRLVNGSVRVSGGCEVFSPGFGASIDKGDAEFLKASAERLNEVLRAKAREHGWVYVGGIADGFAGHGYCTDDARYFVRASESLVLQGDADGTMLPNAYGHQVYGDAIASAIRAHQRVGLSS